MEQINGIKKEKGGFGEKITGDLREHIGENREWSAENNINRDG